MLRGLCIRVDNPDTTFETIVESTLSSTSSEDLGLDNDVVTACSN